MSPEGWFDGPRAKFRRAHEHYVALENEIKWFLESDGYSLTSDIDDKTGEYVVRIKINRLPDLQRWALLVGDFCTNAMATLDHLAYHLTVLCTKQDPPPRERLIYFPIARNSDDWKRERNGNIPDIDARFQAIIEAAQPYHTHAAPPVVEFTAPLYWRGEDGYSIRHSPDTGPPRKGIEHPLVLLQEITRRDKHRLIPVLTMAMAGKTGILGVVTVNDPMDPRFDEDYRAMLQNMATSAVEDGAVVARYPPSAADQYPKMDMEVDVTYQVRFEPGPPFEGLVIPDALKGILDFIENEIVLPLVGEIRAKPELSQDWHRSPLYFWR